ncbi:MAG: hypothetical protein CMF74_18010 [Maricaulis sp.]|jgi:hypothetical protein|nr:hypothetical protein [Maricaulis sp.]MAL11543.1 hypothetical protein [Maricaulis sp.]HAQ35065.1 hypothetical protein [Alphaproteobacteria bacterium]
MDIPNPCDLFYAGPLFGEAGEPDPPPYPGQPPKPEPGVNPPTIPENPEREPGIERPDLPNPGVGRPEIEPPMREGYSAARG